MPPSVANHPTLTPYIRFVALFLFPCAVKLATGIVHDGLWDVYNDHHMGICAEKCSVAYGVDREAQDKHATESYERAALAWDKVRSALRSGLEYEERMFCFESWCFWSMGVIARLYCPELDRPVWW